MPANQPAEVDQPVPFGPYLLERCLGRGGMAEVWKARTAGMKGFEKVVCVKRVLPRLQSDPKFIQMFVREARLAARMSHPNIVQVFDLGEVNGEIYMAMEFVRGHDLLKLLRACSSRRRPMPVAMAAHIGREVCRALAHAHEFKGEDGTLSPIVHRDVSPHNVMLGDEGTVKLVDFGVAKALQEGNDLTRTGVVKGKLAYLAPEQLAGAPPSPQTDVFSLGIVLFEMLANRRLFRGPNEFETLLRVREMTIPAPSTLNPVVPPVLDEIALKALRREPTERYQRASQIARDLDRYCGQAEFTADDLRQFLKEMLSDDDVEAPPATTAPRSPRTPPPPPPPRASAVQAPTFLAMPTPNLQEPPASGVGSDRPVRLVSTPESPTLLDRHSARVAPPPSLDSLFDEVIEDLPAAERSVEVEENAPGAPAGPAGAAPVCTLTDAGAAEAPPLQHDTLTDPGPVERAKRRTVLFSAPPSLPKMSSAPAPIQRPVSAPRRQTSARATIFVVLGLLLLAASFLIAFYFVA